MREITISRLLDFGMHLLFIPLFLVGCLSGGCKKLVEPGPPESSITEENVFNTDMSAISVLTGIYAKMASANGGSEEIGKFSGPTGISFLSGLSADELTLYPQVTNARYIAYYKNALVSSANQSIGSEHWASLYNYIFICNAALQGLQKLSL
jgi:starch-binding outer membrane protein, SusD/RagB family